jgi:hypothetical protein
MSTAPSAAAIEKGGEHLATTVQDQQQGDHQPGQQCHSRAAAAQHGDQRLVDQPASIAAASASLGQLLGTGFTTHQQEEVQACQYIKEKQTNSQ